MRPAPANLPISLLFFNRQSVVGVVKKGKIIDFRTYLYEGCVPSLNLPMPMHILYGTVELNLTIWFITSKLKSGSAETTPTLVTDFVVQPTRTCV